MRPRLLQKAEGVAACLKHLDRHHVVLEAARVVEGRHLGHSAIAASIEARLVSLVKP